MLKKLTIASFLLTALTANAQLVNGGFEVNSAIPSNMGQWQVVQGWGNAGSLVASPDYFHYSGNFTCDLPETALSMVDAFEGEAIMGFIASGRAQTNLREYLSTEFSAPLEIGKKYTVKFHITNGDKTVSSLSGLGVDKIGLLFTANPVVQIDQTPINATPQFRIESVLYSENWETVSFTIVPDQPFKYLTLGVFGDDSDKNITIIDGADPMFAYYFVDDFSIDLIRPDEGISNTEKEPKPQATTDTPVNPGVLSDELFYVPNSFTPNNDANNDLFKAVSATVKEWKFEIFTKWGDRVFATEDENAGWDGTFNGMHCANGTYVWQITYLSIDDAKRPEEIEIKGMVNLLR